MPKILANWSADKHRFIHEVLLFDCIVRMWCAISTTRIIGPIFLDTVNSDRYHGQIIEPLFFLGEEKKYRCL
jgi:hypothetical protein